MVFVLYIIMDRNNIIININLDSRRSRVETLNDLREVLKSLNILKNNLDFRGLSGLSKEINACEKRLLKVKKDLEI
jgi:hypothetical protein